MLISLHIGAHETATAYIQNELMEHRQSLAAANVGVVFHGFFRKQVTAPLDEAGREVYAFAKPRISRAVAKMLAFHAERDRVVMSDENLAGPAIGPQGLYGDVKERLAVVLGATPRGHETRVFLCVRSYEPFFNAMFAYGAFGRAAGDDSRTRSIAMLAKRGWAEVVADIASVAGAERTTVWTYRDFVGGHVAVGREMLGESAPAMFEKFDRAASPELSRKGLSVLQRAAPLLSEAEQRALARAAARCKFDPPDDRFSLFDAAQSTELAERYERDLATIARSGCRLLTPETAAPPSDA